MFYSQLDGLCILYSRDYSVTSWKVPPPPSPPTDPPPQKKKWRIEKNDYSEWRNGGLDQFKGSRKRGNNVAEKLSRKQMFPRLRLQETFVAEAKMFLNFFRNMWLPQQILCSPRNHFGKHCFRNNVSSFTGVLSNKHANQYLNHPPPMLGSLRFYDGDGNNNGAKQWYHWLKEHQ